MDFRTTRLFYAYYANAPNEAAAVQHFLTTSSSSGHQVTPVNDLFRTHSCIRPFV